MAKIGNTYKNDDRHITMASSPITLTIQLKEMLRDFKMLHLQQNSALLTNENVALP